jgi:hypothetical protein
VTNPPQPPAVTNSQQPTEQWKATLDWYKQLMTVNGVAGVAIAAFLTFAGRTNSVQPSVITVGAAYLAIFAFLLSVGLAVVAMFRVINNVKPVEVGDLDDFLERRLKWRYSPIVYSASAFVLFVLAVILHLWTLLTSVV